MVVGITSALLVAGLLGLAFRTTRGLAIAAFAALKTQAPVIERFGLQGFGGHTADNEYVLLETIEARLYLAARVVMDVSRGRGL